MTPVYSPIGSAPACPRSYAAEVASLETPLRVGTSCHLQLLHVLAIGVPRKRRSSSGFLKTRRTRLPRSGLVQCDLCGAPDKSHARRKVYEFYESTKSPLAREVLERIAPLFEIEARINGQVPERRLAVRQAEAVPLLAELKSSMDKVLSQISGAGTLAKAIRYATSRWSALTRYTTDGRLEMTNNAAERAIRPLAMTRKNFVFLGSDAGGDRAA